MKDFFKRRRFIKSLVALPLFSPVNIELQAQGNHQDRNINSGPSKLKISLNAFSFNGPLMDKKMSLADLLETSAALGFDGIDITAYYFPGYPTVPDDNYLNHVKRSAFRVGLDITGTGVRNDFTEPDKVKRAEQVLLVKNWIDAAAKLGAPVIRIFAGTQNPQGYTRPQVLEWMMEDIRDCVAFGKQRGIIVAIQNHNDFIQTADEANEIVEKINSEWFGLILDTGSYRTRNPYDEIALSAKYAVNWQIKEHVFINGNEVPADIPRLIKIIRAAGYRGYLPIETLGPGNPKANVTALFNKVSESIALPL